MGRYVGPSCRVCRREGMKLFLKGMKCETAKCQIKRYYGVYEQQFMRFFREASRLKGNTGENLLQLLERRLDNVVYKLNFAASRKAARQLVAHGHIHVNGRKVDVSDYMINIGDKITVKDSEKSQKRVKQQLESNPNFTTQGWLQLDREKPAATVVALPGRTDVQIPVEEHLVVEFCSR